MLEAADVLVIDDLTMVDQIIPLNGVRPLSTVFSWRDVVAHVLARNDAVQLTLGLAYLALDVHICGYFKVYWFSRIYLRIFRDSLGLGGVHT